MDPNLANLSKRAVITLTPFLPYLINAAEFSAEALSEVIVQHGGQKVWQRAQSLWRAIYNHYSDDDVIIGMTIAAAAAPVDTSIQQTLAMQLVQRLEKDPDLVHELLNIFKGQEAMQEVEANAGSRVEKVRQEIEGSVGVQRVGASGKGTVTDVTQSIKESK